MWVKGGRSQAIPTLAPGKGYEGWGKGGQKVGIVRESPPLPQATGIKGGGRVDKRWESSEKAHPMPMQRV